MTKIAVRGYTQRLEKPKTIRSFRSSDIPLRHDRVLVFDTETTIDQYQNLKIGHFQIYQDGFIQHEGLFYDSTILSENETKILQIYSRKHNISLHASSVKHKISPIAHVFITIPKSFYIYVSSPPIYS